MDRARQYFELADVILVGIGPDGRVRHVNRKGCELLGFPLAEIVGRNWIDNFLPARVRDDVWRVFKRFTNGDGEAPDHFENPILCRGSERTITSRNAVLRDETGRIVEVVASGEDVTDKRRAEDALRESEARFRARPSSRRRSGWRMSDSMAGSCA